MFSFSPVYFSLWCCDDIGVWFHADSSDDGWLLMIIFLCFNLVIYIEWRELFCLLSVVLKFLFVFLILYFSFYYFWLNIFWNKKWICSR